MLGFGYVGIHYFPNHWTTAYFIFISALFLFNIALFMSYIGKVEDTKKGAKVLACIMMSLPILLQGYGLYDKELREIAKTQYDSTINSSKNSSESVGTADSRNIENNNQKNQTSSTPASNPSNTSKINHSIKDTYLPDFMAFSNNTVVLNNEGINFTSTFVSYKMDKNVKAVNEYMELIQSRYNYKKTDQKIKDYLYEWTFDYTGNGNVSTFQVQNFGKKNMSVYIRYWIAGSTLDIEYGDGIEYVDTGDRTSFKLKKMEASNSSRTSSKDSMPTSANTSAYKTKDHIIQNKCTRYGCDNGKIECDRCDGKGGKYIYDHSTPNYTGKSAPTTSKTWQTCSKCGGSGSMDCPTCGGDGYVD